MFLGALEIFGRVKGEKTWFLGGSDEGIGGGACMRVCVCLCVTLHPYLKYKAITVINNHQLSRAPAKYRPDVGEGVDFHRVHYQLHCLLKKKKSCHSLLSFQLK